MEAGKDRIATSPEAPKILTPEQRARITVYGFGGVTVAMIAGIIYIFSSVNQQIETVSNSRDITKNGEVDSISLHNHQVSQYTPRTVMLTRGQGVSIDLLDTDSRAAIKSIEEVCGRRSAIPAVESNGQSAQYFKTVFIDTDETGCVEKLSFARG